VPRQRADMEVLTMGEWEWPIIISKMSGDQDGAGVSQLNSKDGGGERSTRKGYSGPHFRSQRPERPEP
jgi:hypothetical protein